MVSMCWTRARTAVRRSRRSERGNSVVEYALLVALVAVVCLAAVALVGATTGESLSRSASTLY